MKPNLQLLDRHRKVHPTLGDSPMGSDYGYFQIHGMNIISSGSHPPDSPDQLERWEHVSVSRPTRTPHWREMCFVKSLFWGDDETVLQFHPKKSQYINNMEFCLHLWKKVGTDHELPPGACV